MELEETKLAGCYLIKPTIFSDNRGSFYESFNQRKFKELSGLDVQFVQDNQSFSTYGVLRGLHFQVGEFAQAKLVRVLQGNVLDVAVDLRVNSPTFGKYIGVELSDENQLQLFIPRGFAHGFIVLSEQARFFYKCDNYYNKSAESGIVYNDPDLDIDWKLANEKIILSNKDLELPKYRDTKF